jgi:anti-sigma factor (TIGR02949 family)
MTYFTRFTCEEAFRRLDDYLDRELAAEEMDLVRSHLEICAGCAREFNYEQSALRGVRSKLRRIDVPPDLRSRILAALRDEKESGRRTSDGDGSS